MATKKGRILDSVTGLAIYTCMECLCTPGAVVEAHRPMVKPKLESRSIEIVGEERHPSEKVTH